MAGVYEKMTALADAIRERSGVSGLLSLDGMTSAVRGIIGGGVLGGVVDGTASIIAEGELAGVEEIRNYAFYGCEALRSVSLPDSLKKIGTYAFYNCSELKDIALPEGLTSLGARCFMGCRSLERMVIPEGVTSLPAYCFNGCTGLETLILVGDTVKTLTNINALSGTDFADVLRPVYIAPVNGDAEELIASYREATNWADYEIPFAPISEYEGEW